MKAIWEPNDIEAGRVVKNASGTNTFMIVSHMNKSYGIVCIDTGHIIVLDKDATYIANELNKQGLIPEEMLTS